MDKCQVFWVSFLPIKASWRIFALANCVTIGSCNDVSPARHQPITRTNTDLQPIGLMETKFIEI